MKARHCIALRLMPSTALRAILLPRWRADMTESESMAFHAAITAARDSATRMELPPVQAAMEVMCAYLVVNEQLKRAQRASSIDEKDPSVRVPVARDLLAASGFDADTMPSEQAVRAMSLLGLQPLLRVRKPICPDEPSPSVPPHLGGWKKAVAEWLLRTSR